MELQDLKFKVQSNVVLSQVVKMSSKFLYMLTNCIDTREVGGMRSMFPPQFYNHLAIILILKINCEKNNTHTCHIYLYDIYILISSSSSLLWVAM